MNRKLIALIGAGALALLALWLFRSPAGPIANSASTPAPAASPAPARATESKTQNPEPKTSARDASLYPDAARALNAPTSDIRADLRALDELLATYRSNFARLGNPVGSNAEIAAALTGKNKLKLALLPSDHPAINAQGELCDRWGTPFFFHAESATRMTLRSAGPDKKMWNEDDVEFAP